MFKAFYLADKAHKVSSLFIKIEYKKLGQN